MLTPVSRGRLGTFRVYRYVRHCGFDCVGQTGGSTPLVLTDDTLLPGMNGDDSLAPGLKPFSPRTRDICTPNFLSGDKILHCYHSNDTSMAKLLLFIS